MQGCKGMLKTATHILARTLLGSLIAPIGFFSLAANAQSNQTSPLGTNLNGVTYWSPELPFLNIFKTASSWITGTISTWDTGEQNLLVLDANGYPTCICAAGGQTATFTQLHVLVLRNLGSSQGNFYPSGQYVVL